MVRKLVCCAVFAGLLATAPGHASQLAPESPDQLASAPRIVVADVLAAQSRWNAQGTLIVTDYTFRRVETLRGQFEDRFVLTQGGGTVGEDTHQLSDLPVLRAGARYLLILNKQDNAVFSSMRYGAAGAIEVDRATARLRGGEDLADFRTRVQHTAVVDDAALRPASGGAVYPANIYRRDEVPTTPASYRPLDAQQPALPPAPLRSDGATVQIEGLSEPLSPFVPDYLVQRAPAPTILFNPLPLAWIWSPSDQNMMSEWNRYGDIFRVSAPTGTWAWNNDRYDLAGFPTDTDMIAQFGAPWGATTLGVTYSRWVGSGNILESDVALNPAFPWTLDDALGTDATTPDWSFRQTMLHELGHAWGLQHPWETQNVFWPSTMNYGPKWVRDPNLHSDDTAGIRSVYPGIALHDGSLSMYRTVDDAASGNPIYLPVVPSAASFTHGQNLTFTGAALLQNLGTTNLVNPVIDVYLSGTRLAYANVAYIGRSNYTATIPPFPNALQQVNLGSYPIASTTPTGSYFPVIFLAGSGASDAAPSNNSAWGALDQPVVINNVITTLVPTASVQTTPIGRIGPSGEWKYSVVAQAGIMYRFSTCTLSTLDSVITVQGSFGSLSNDNGCGTQSDLTWSSSANQTVTVVVRGGTRADTGNFQMNYRLDSDRIFGNGFQP